MSDSSSIPSIRTFQMDASTIGVLKSSVNLFRGDVNYPQTLFTMPGRNDSDGLQIEVAIQYQSNVHRQAVTWNRDQPTGVLGMGWQMPLAQIRYDSGGSPLPGAGSYSITLAGVESRMVRDPQPAPLFTLDGDLTAQLVDGQVVPTAVCNEFVRRGLPLAVSATVVGTAGTWAIHDNELEQEFQLVTDDGALVAHPGGQSFQLVSYKFWQVLYYPRYERWSVRTESGQVMSFGGGVAPHSPQVNTSGGNSIEWGVQWLDAAGIPLWEGNSAVAAGQRQVAVGWHISRVYSRFGEFVSYGYNEFPRNEAGLLPEVEQQVGDGGKAYTKACYLTSVTDVFGRKARFHYAAKLWSDASPAAPREYADPHKPVPDNTPNGYQDRYETRYLQGISVSHPDDTPLFSVDLTYAPCPATPGSEAVANVVPGDSGDTCKRLLTGFSLRNPAGEGLPGYRFDYYLDPGQDTNPGALRSITWPTGGSALYAYQAVELEICARTAPMTAPAPMPANSTPRVWFGDDYAVVLWSNTGTQQLSLQIASWNGQWQCWQVDPDSALLVDGNGGTSLATVTVLTGDDFVGLTYQTSKNVNLHLFRKDPARPGQWVAAEIPGGGNGGCNTPTWQWSLSNGQVKILAGENFVLASQMNTSQNQGSYDLFTWNWPSLGWSHDTGSTASYAWFIAGKQYYAIVDMSSTVKLFHLNPDGVWLAGGSTNLGFTLNNYSSLAIAGDLSLLAVSHLVSGGPAMGQQTYDLFPLQFNGNYDFTTPVPKFTFVDTFDSAYPTSWAPVVIANSLVAVAGNLLRFNGRSWLANSNLKPTTASQSGQQRYAYGPDLATLIRIGNGAPSAQLVGYDADTAGGSWSDGATPITGLVTPPANQATANWAACSNPDYIVVGSQLFFRGTATNWARAVGTNIADLQHLINQATDTSDRYQVNAASLINEAPGFLACAVYDNQKSSVGHATAATALVLRNGTVHGPAQMLAHEQLWTSQEAGDQPGQGKYPGGPGAFFTYPDTATTLDAAPTIYLHHYAGDAIQGPISDRPVASITIDDGLSECFRSSYVQDTATAACDPTGQVVKYFKSTVYPGGDAAAPGNGSVISCYLNGNAITGAGNFYNALDGLLHSVTTCDALGREVASVLYAWQAYVNRAGDPVDPGVTVRQLYGAYVVQTGKSSVSDGVASTQSTSYIPATLAYPYTGQPAATSTTTLNGAGVEETCIVSSTYGCEINDTCRLLNDLTSVVSQTTSCSGVTTAVTVTAPAMWPTAWGEEVLVPAEEADFGWTGGPAAFPFATYRPGDTPANFQRTSRIERRDATGTVVQQADGTDTPAATLISAPLGLPVATFKGAPLDACAWCGFQNYEELDAMHIAGGTICSDNAWFGDRSLRLAPGDGISPTVAGASATPYLLGYRYQTPTGYQDNGSPWFSDTGGAWRYVTVPISPPGGAAPAVGELQLVNLGNTELLLDSVLLVPFGTDVTAQSWEVESRLLRAIQGAGGSTSFHLYDNFQRNLGAVGADGQLQELAVRFLSRQGAPDDAFNDAAPNGELTLQMTSGGTAETFRDGGRWTERWCPGDRTLWSVTGSALVKVSATADDLTWQGNGSASASTAFFIELTPQLPLGGPVAIAFGSGDTIAWSPGSGWAWRDAAGAVRQPPLAEPPRLAGQWLLMLAEGYLLFFADGQLLFSRATTATPGDGCRFSTGPNPTVVNNLIVGIAPRLGLSYTDGAARQRQVHQLCGSDSRIMEIIYDALDRQIAATRVAPGCFGNGAELPTLQYRSSFVDVPNFTAALRNSCRMDGDVADYYAGQQDDRVVRSNDQNYPYSGLRYESTAQNRIVESGRPGQLLAIHDVDTTTPDQRQTTRTTYTASGPGDPVQAGRYLAQYTTTPAGYQGRQLVDTTNRAVAAVQLDPLGNNVGQTTVAPSYDANAGSAGTSGVLLLPNAFAEGPHSNRDAFFRTTVQDPLGQIVTCSDPDCGTIRYLFNGKGQSRFVAVPLEEGENFYHYSRYDLLGRIIEEGIVAAPWDPEVLATQVNDPLFPTASDGAVPSRHYHYDGDGRAPEEIGNLTSVVTSNLAPAAHPELGECTVTEQWGYDSLGRVGTATLEVRGAADLTATVCYHYNTLNEVERIDLPEGSPLAAVTFAYDDQGQIVAIGVPGSVDAIASYTWSADGQVQTARRGKLEEVWNYDSPGNVLAHLVHIDNEELFAQLYTYTPDRQVATRETRCAGTVRSVTYAYDGQQRLSVAEVANGQPGNQSVTRYDADGNIWNGTQDSKPFSATCTPGTNRLATATLADGRQVEFHYRANGNPDQWRGLTIDYDPGLSSTRAITQGDNTVRYGRGINNSRVLRQQGDSLRIAFQGAGNTPLVIWKNGRPQLCIWGPTGLVAFHDGTTLQYPINDHQNTVWAVADPEGNPLAEFDYFPFGAPLGGSGTIADDWLFRFCGKEWDEVTGLYDFGARLYDPALLRFVSADPARQYASPYLFSSNNPLNVVDPSGNLSVWAQVGIGAAMALVAIGGIALSMVSFGTAAAPAAAAEGALAGATAAGDIEMVALGGEAAAGVMAEGAAEGAGAGAAELAAGAATEAAAPLTTAQLVGQNALAVLQSTACSALSGAGTSGLTYDVQHGRDFSAKGFFEAMGVGALSGAVTGFAGGLATMPATVGLSQGMSVTSAVLFRALVQGSAGLIGKDVATVLTDAVTGQKITVGQLLLSSAQGFGTGALSGTFGGVKATSPGAAAVCATDRAIVRASTVIGKGIETATAAATSQAAIATYIAGGFFLVSGYTVWGVYQATNSRTA